MITFARSVGVAPGTTTLHYNVNGLGIQCYPVPESIATYRPGPKPPITTAPKRGTVYADEAELKAGLGYVMTRAEITRTLPPTGGYHAEYTDENITNNALGAIPTDAELARDRCYTPYHSGWTYLQRDKSAALGGDPETLEALKRYQKLSLIISSLSVIGMVTLAGVGVYRAIKDYQARPIIGGGR